MANGRRVASLIPIVAVLVGGLTACGATGSGGRPAATSARPAAAAAAAFDLLHDSEAADAFAAGVRAQFPAVAAGRTDAVLRDDGAHVCVDDLPAGGERRALTDIGIRFAGAGAPPDPSTAAGILALARSTVCAAASTP
ncbi:hypothetical protein [Frankia sp. AgB32]|uniref:hypothetical protein n=1 Tax=Frankia sp. AgB32 TaxID=631119 RepID=UPI00200FEE3A|nr:hypothetical protein [Frankia sp. AgB32]MCK9897176.1 hypothetical protein [Frankia sp. AgB32]